MRAIWKGFIRFSLVTIPINVYSAVESAGTISFNQLHKEDNGRVGYEKKCKKCGKVLSNDEIVKGYEYQPDQYIVIENEDLQKIKLESTKTIEIEGFVNATEVSPMLYDSPYFIGPDGEVAKKAYALFTETLKQTGKMGIGKVVMRDREDMIMISPEENGMMMFKLRYPNELRNISSVPQLNGLKADKDQLQLAKTLVESMTTTMDKIEIKDKYQDALRELIEAKAEGKEIVSAEKEIKPVTDIMAALKQSIEQAKKEKMPMEKAKGKVKEKEKEEKKPVRARKRKQA
jgi:DNA end-binding protein Ku